MSIMEKRIFTNINDVKTYLQSIGFVISGNKILWSYAEDDTQCYWKIDNNTINFQLSDGTNAFTKSLVDFDMENRPKCGIAVVFLQDNGIALYMGMVTESTSIGDITVNCQNYNATLNNGLIVLSPAEDDEHWYYGWNHPYSVNNERTCWCFDNGHGNLEINYGTNNCQISSRLTVRGNSGTGLINNIALNRVYLNTGYWSKNIRELVVGQPTVPGSVFKLQGQKYITFCSSVDYRCPVYKLAPEEIEMNDSTSTEPYSSVKTYVVGDYCTFNGFVYRCITAITTPEPFDDSKWTLTTVPNELISAGDHIYGA